MRKHTVGNTRNSSISKYSRRAFSGASALALAGSLAVSFPAVAQTNSDAEGQSGEEQAPSRIDDKTAEKVITTANDIVVVGTRASLQSAINRKKDASTVVDSIVADDIASFPDTNIRDSLARITGVHPSRAFG